MFKARVNKKGIVLLLILGTLLVVLSLATVIISIIMSHARLTHHQTSRIQAYYASLAGVNYALEKLRVGDANWIPSPDAAPNTRTRILCRSGCIAPNVNDPDLPNSIQQVTIVIEAAGTGISGTRRLKATAAYTYTP